MDEQQDRMNRQPPPASAEQGIGWKAQQLQHKQIERLEAELQAAQEREKGLREVAERFVRSPVFSPAQWQEEFRRALAAQRIEEAGG